MNKKIVVVGACALLLAACTQKTASSADEAMAKNDKLRSPLVQASESPKASSSSTFVFNLDSVTATSSPVATARGNSGQGSEKSGSTRLGKATFREVGGKVTVSIAMENKAATSSAQPAHIHVGVCPQPGAVKYPLTSVVNGSSETTLPAGVTIASLKALGPLAVNVHKSATELTKYIACGNLDFTRGADNAMENEDEHESGGPKASHTPKASELPKPSKTPKASTGVSASPAL